MARYRVDQLVAAQAITATGATRSTDATGFLQGTVYINFTAVSGTTPSLTPTVQTSPDNGTTWFDYATGTAMTAAGQQVIKLPSFAPGLARVSYVVSGTTPSFTGSIWFENCAEV